jgi:hypothetical protein
MTADCDRAPQAFTMTRAPALLDVAICAAAKRTIRVVDTRMIRFICEPIVIAAPGFDSLVIYPTV